MALHESQRIHDPVVVPNLEMHVGSGRAPSGTGLGDDIADADTLARLRDQGAVVGIARHVAVAMVDFDDIAIAVSLTREGDHALGDGGHGRTRGGSDVDTRVARAVATEWIGPATEIRRDVAIHRHARWAQARLDVAVHQHVAEGFELGLLGIELARQVVDALAEGFGQRVRAGIRAVGYLEAALAGLLVEIEFAVIQLAYLGEALTEGIEANGLGLELPEFDRQRVEVALGVAPDRRDLGILVADLFLQAT